MTRRKIACTAICTKCGSGDGVGTSGLCRTCRIDACRVVLYPWTPAMDDRLRAAYRSSTKKQLSEQLTQLQSVFRFPRHVLQNRAQALGLSFVEMNPWRDEEIAFLEQHAETLSLKKLAARLHRSESSVKQFLFRRGIPGRCHEGYSGKQLGERMRVSNVQIAAWIRRGLLERSDSIADRITQASVRRLLTYHMEEFSLRRVDERWMKMLVREELESIRAVRKPVQSVGMNRESFRRSA